MSRSSEDEDIERELVTAMNEFAGRSPAPHYDPAGVIVAARRRGRQVWALAAAVVGVAAIGGGVAVLTSGSGGGGGGGQAVPAGPSGSRPVASASTDPSAGPAPSTHPVAGASPSAAVGKGGPADAYARQREEVRIVVTAAMQWENPATRARVHLPTVAAQFADHAVYLRVMAKGGLGVTCGKVADGAVSSDPAQVLFYTGAQKLGKLANFSFDPATSKVTGVSCASSAAHGDVVVANVYGSAVSGGKSADGAIGPKVASATCGVNKVRSWFADDPAAGTLTEGWTVRLDGGKPLTAVVDPNAGMLTGVNCSPKAS